MIIDGKKIAAEMREELKKKVIELKSVYNAVPGLTVILVGEDVPSKIYVKNKEKFAKEIGMNSEAWLWYYKVVGDSRCPIVDTWWQTETGGILISPQPGAIDLKPGSATKPFYGIKPVIVDEKGQTLKGACRGRLCIAQSWPGQMRTVYGDHQRFIDTYFSQFNGKYFTGDGCRRDEDGYYWITGRVDDVIIVSGHNLGTAELESAFVAHPKVAEAAVVGYPHDIKGNGLYCYVTLNAGERTSGELERDLKLWVRKQIGPIATPDLIQFAPGLPKTRSGKIMRRILRKIAANQHDQLGDTSTLADPSVVESLVKNRKKLRKIKKAKSSKSSELIFKVQKKWANNAYVDKKLYEKKYKLSIKDNDGFWKKEGKRIDWIKPYTKIKDVKYSKNDVKIKWYYDGTLNASANCIDRHLKDKKNKTAIIWVGDDPKDSKQISYKELHKNVCKAANGLKELGIKKGDRVTIYLTMIPELAYVMLACARIGAIHSIIFGGFSPDSIAGRINDCQSDYIITADEGVRGGKIIPLKKITDEALSNCPNVKKCIVVKRTGNEINWVDGRDVWYDQIVNIASDKCEPEEMSAEDPLFILYTSGSTGKPKGVLHTTGGYLVYASMTHQYIFDYKKNDIYWCSADIGWVTGHSYIIYGPLSNGATTMMFEGIPNYPDVSRWWKIIDKYKVNIFYTAPTALRALMKEGEVPVKKTSRKSLKLLGTVGEPINPEAWLWYYKVVGDSRCPIVDTWWQTETGGILISPQPGAIDLKPGSATKPFYGIKPVIVDEKGQTLKGACRGRLCIAQSWPGQMRTVYGDHQRFIDTYFSQFNGKYFTGDGCRRDEDGYYWITGRVDDVIIVSGHNLGTAELESAFVAHPKVAEAAVVGYPHDIKGNGLYCYVTLNAGERTSGELERDLKLWVRKQIGPIATPDLIQFAPGLPKTRSGKIMRRILRKIAANQHDQLGDTSTLADPSVVESLVENRKNK